MGDHLPDNGDDRPRHVKRAVKPRRKKYGIEQWSRWFKKWCHRQWYATAKARDQALEDLKRHTCNVLKDTDHEPQYRKVDR
jgi:hypothetical protein